MNMKRMSICKAFAALSMLVGLFSVDVSMADAAPPVKLVPKGSISHGFDFAEAVAGTAAGNIYVADAGNRRIQELTSTGQFVLMFGKDVNGSTKGDICTREEEEKSVKCQVGVEGDAPGQFGAPFSLAVDPNTHDVYVAEYDFAPGEFGLRVQKFGAEGKFLLEIGKEVNETTKGNLCTREEEEKASVKCTGPALRKSGDPYIAETGSFNFRQSEGNLLAVDSSGDLYVADESRVQKFNEDGEADGEVNFEIGAHATAVAIDQLGDLYVAYTKDLAPGNTVNVFDPEGKSSRSFEVPASGVGAAVHIVALAGDSEGRLALVARQSGGSAAGMFGSLYEASSARFLTAFAVPSEQVKGVGFDGKGELFAATSGEQNVLLYAPEPVAELVSGSAPCVPGADRGTDATFDCSLKGEINPEGVDETEAWFEWGRVLSGNCSLSATTVKQKIATGTALMPVNAAIEALRPNEGYCYRSVGEDRNVKTPENVTGEGKVLNTPLVAPRIVGTSSVPSAKTSSAVMFDAVNSENARTEYYFEYTPEKKALAQCESPQEECPSLAKTRCAGVTRTSMIVSSVYGATGVTLEASGLQPGTEYSYRLYAESENSAKTEKCATTGTIGSFETKPAPAPSAETGGFGGVTPTSAVISGVLDPDGATATYAFELGVYAGAGTQYGVVATGFAGSSEGSVGESLALTDLQPGTTYAYRISVTSGYLPAETHTLLGQPVVFTTAGLPTVIGPPVELAQLPVPSIAFPKTAPAPKKKPKVTAKRPKRNRKKSAKRRKAAHS